jgi:hypothetical protein
MAKSITDRDIRMCDLPEQPAPGVKLFCSDCLNEYSAHRGDYFLMRPDDVMTCCGESLRLVRERTILEDVDLP